MDIWPQIAFPEPSVQAEPTHQPAPTWRENKPTRDHTAVSVDARRKHNKSQETATNYSHPQFFFCPNLFFFLKSWFQEDSENAQLSPLFHSKVQNCVFDVLVWNSVWMRRARTVTMPMLYLSLHIYCLYSLLLHCLCGQSLLSKPNQDSPQSLHLVPLFKKPLPQKCATQSWARDNWWGCSRMQHK